jgi:L-fucose isomerase-like protein
MNLFNTLLNQFSSDQLDCILGMTEEKIEVVQLARMKAELKEDSEEVSWLLKDIDKDLDTLYLFRAQLMNAKLDVEQLQHLN